VRRLLPLVASLAALVACGPPRASQFVGQDGSRDWWTVECRGDEEACWAQAKAVCVGSFQVHELRAGDRPPEPVTLTVKDGAVPSGTSVAGKVLVLSCSGASAPPRYAAGPECPASPPRMNHCDDAAGEEFRTGRAYLAPPASASDASSDLKGAEATLDELRKLTDGVDAEVTALVEPVRAVDAVVKSLADLPRTFRMKPARVKAMAKAALGSGSVTVPSDVRPEAVDDVKELLGRLKATFDALSAIPDRAAALHEKLTERRAKLAQLTVKARTAFAAVVAGAHATAEEKATAESDLRELGELKEGAAKKLDALDATLNALPARATEALSRLGAAAS